MSGLWPWVSSRALYWRFTASFLVLFLAGFVTFYLFPAAPPWMAAEKGMIPNLDRVLVSTLSTLPATQPFALAYQKFSPNTVAAMPSLHAALPMLLALIAVRIWGRRALPLLAYPFLAGMAWVYMGEHYFIDVLIGWLYGIAAFVLVWGLAFPRLALAIERAARSLAPKETVFRKPLPAWPLAALALVIMGYVWVDPLLRGPYSPPAGPIWVALGPPAPPGAVEEVAGEPSPQAQSMALQAAPCGSDTPASSEVDALLSPITPSYSAYVIGLGSPVCYAISAGAAIPPPDGADLEEMEPGSYLTDARVLSLSDDAPGYVSVIRAGTPSPALQQATGVDSSGIYAVVIRAGGVESPEDLIQVARAVGEALLQP
jgi:membrane-associated phospholipid phosphatase